MTDVELQAVTRLREAIIRRMKERDRDLLYLRKAGSKGISV